MSVRSSPYFNSPAFAQAASNLAGLFEPPSGADAAGWAAANAKKAEAQRLADFYDYSKAPNFDQQAFDRMGVGAGVYQPNQSYYSVDQGNATTMRGQDVTAATSRANNSDDNARALETNRVSELGKFYQPLNEGQVRPDIPVDIASQFGVERALPAAQGREKPLTLEEAKAGEFSGMSPEMRQAITFGSTPVESVVTPEGPRIATRLDSVGQVPYEAPKGAGMTTTLPDGTVISMGGDKPITEAQGKLVNYGTTATQMDEVINKLGGSLTDPVQGMSEASPTIGTLNPGNYAQTPEYQQARVAGQRFVQSILRNESGAATPDAEIAHYNATLLPRPGDQPETVLLKAWARQVAVNALEGGMTLQARKAAVDAALQSGPPPGFAPGQTDAADAAPAAPAQPNIPTVSSPEEAAKLPSGTQFKTPDGRIKVRP